MSLIMEYKLAYHLKKQKKYPEPKFLHDRFENGESFIEFRMRIEGFF